MNKNRHLVRERLSKLTKFSGRLNKQLVSGQFKRLSRHKQEGLIRRLQRVYKQLASVLPEARLKHLMGPAVAVLLGVSTNSVSGQAFAPQVSAPFGLASGNAIMGIAFGDLDNDGDFDALIGDSYSGDILYYENTGTAAAPAFAAAQTNPFGIATSYGPMFPELVDIDNDGDLDLLVGGYTSSVEFMENTGTASAPAFGAVQIDPFGIAAGTFTLNLSSGDLDGDGDFDLLMGDYNGDVVYLENTGTAAAPAFGTAQINPFGLTGVDAPSFPTMAMIDGDSDLDVLVSDYTGDFIHYRNTGTAQAPAFSAGQTNPFGLSRVYYYGTPAFVDIDNDGDMDMFSTDYYGDLVYFENISPADDLGVSEVINPEGASCDYTASETIEVLVTNSGTAAQNSFDVSYRINGGTPVTETVSQALPAGGTYIHAFAQTVDMSAEMNYDIEAWTTLTGDANTANDTNMVAAVHAPLIDTYPYLEDFESGNGGWLEGGSSSSWELGTPAGATITTAASGTNAWMTNLTGEYDNNEDSYVESPCFDLTAMINCVVEVKINHDIESGYDGVSLWSSIDGGASWQIVGAVGDTANWYNNSAIVGLEDNTGNGDGWDGLSSGWITAQHDISFLDGEADVKFRMVFGSDGSVTEDGLAFDDFKITGVSTLGVDETVDLRALNVYPNPASDNVVVELTNATGKTQLELWSSDGKLVLSDRIDADGNRVNINVADLANGLYTVRVVQEDKVFVQRLSIQK